MKARFNFAVCQRASLASVYSLLFLSGLLLLIAPRAGHAQPPGSGYGGSGGSARWDITYTYSGSSKIKVTNADGTTASDTNTAWNNTTGPSYIQSGLAPGQSVVATIDGTITAKFTWNANGTGLPAPPNVKVEMIGETGWSCSADASNTAITATGTCSDTIPGNKEYPQDTGQGKKRQAPKNPDPPDMARFIDESGSTFTVMDKVSATVSVTVTAGSTNYGVKATFSPKVFATPYDFKRGMGYGIPQPGYEDTTDGVLSFNYTWKSTTGKLADLDTNGIKIYEHTVYGVNMQHPFGSPDNPYYPPNPPFNYSGGVTNPADYRINRPYTDDEGNIHSSVVCDGGLGTLPQEDKHIPGPLVDGTGQFTAVQDYRFYCPALHGPIEDGNCTVLDQDGQPHPIVRKVDFSGYDGPIKRYKYSITKQGSTATKIF